MKVRKMIILVAALMLIGSTAVFADTISTKVRMIINKQSYDDAGVLVDGKAYLSVSAVRDAMQAITVWDNDAKQVSIFKPNVHMFVMEGSKPFGAVDRNKKLSFRVFSQIDNLKTTSLEAFKVTISDTYGEETLLGGITSKDAGFPKGKDNFWFQTEPFAYEFKSAGSYTIRFWMKLEGGPYQVVAEKLIHSQ